MYFSKDKSTENVFKKKAFEAKFIKKMFSTKIKMLINML